MEETTIMNTKHLTTCITSCLLGLLCLAGCTEQELPVTPPAGQGQGLCFAVRQADTKMSYDNVRSDFEAGDTIGCVITVNGTYQANSAWHYNAANGMLILDYIWGTKQNQWYISRISYDDTTNNMLISRDNDTEGVTGFIGLKQEGTYNFYFYYPYIANDLIREDIYQAIDKYTEDNSTVFYRELQYPNSATNSNLQYTNQWGGAATLTKNDWSSFATVNYTSGEAYTENNAPRYNWQAFPCFVNHTQTSKTQINNSDFLWVSRTGITSASNQTINLVFQKKMATIEVVSDVQLTDVYFQAQSAGNLRRGKEINLSNGMLSDYTYPTAWAATLFQENCCFTTDEQILPYNNSAGAGADGTNYRLVLPAQDAFLCDLHFTLNGTAHTIDLSANIGSLAEGTLYIIHINREGETTLEIVDWENEHYEILDPSTDAETVNS